MRFYEIPQRDLADKISIYTNSQSAVKPRDLRSNDKRVLPLKKAYEGAYPSGYMITKRGEERPADRDEKLTVDIALLAKCLMAWHCQRPNSAYNENKLFDKYFEQRFKADYLPADIAGLTFWSRRIEDRWNDGLPLHEALLASPSYSKFHLFYTIQLFFSAASNQIDKVPAPSATVTLPDPDALIGFAANCYNSALDAGMAEYQEKGKIFSPQNWLKAKDSLLKLHASVNMFMGFMSAMPEARMNGCHLEDTNLTCANLRAAHFQRAELFLANLDRTNFDRTVFGDTIFANVDLSTAMGLESALRASCEANQQRTPLACKSA